MGKKSCKSKAKDITKEMVHPKGLGNTITVFISLDNPIKNVSPDMLEKTAGSDLAFRDAAEGKLDCYMKLCSFWKAGRCNNADQCWYAHLKGHRGNGSVSHTPPTSSATTDVTPPSLPPPPAPTRDLHAPSAATACAVAAVAAAGNPPLPATAQATRPHGGDPTVQPSLRSITPPPMAPPEAQVPGTTTTHHTMQQQHQQQNSSETSVGGVAWGVPTEWGSPVLPPANQSVKRPQPAVPTLARQPPPPHSVHPVSPSPTHPHPPMTTAAAPTRCSALPFPRGLSPPSTPPPPVDHVPTADMSHATHQHHQQWQQQQQQQQQQYQQAVGVVSVEWGLRNELGALPDSRALDSAIENSRMSLSDSVSSSFTSPKAETHVAEDHVDVGVLVKALNRGGTASREEKWLGWVRDDLGAETVGELRQIFESSHWASWDGWKHAGAPMFKVKVETFFSAPSQVAYF